jgi:hypothetical protein
MTARRPIMLKVLTGAFALDNGNIQIEGQTDTDPVEIEIPGEDVRALVVSLTSLLPKARAASPEGKTIAFQLTHFQVTTSEFPDHVQLDLTVAPDHRFSFSLRTSMLDDIGQQLQEAAAEAREGQIQSGRKPQ